MSFDSIRDQAPAIQTLRAALARGRVHHAYRFEGPEGVGKERAAFALAQALLCERSSGEGCGSCSACTRAVTLAAEEPRVPLHPDVVLVERGLYPSSIVSASEATGISVEQVRRVVLGRAGYPPHEGRALVFIIREAHELTVQAANALLKTLEEPIPRVHFVLLTSEPKRLLDTIRSRTLAIRFGPLSDATITEILEARGAPTRLAPLAEGSAALALRLADSESLERHEGFARAALEALAAPDLATGLSFAEARAHDRDTLKSQLGFLSHQLAARVKQLLDTAPEAAEREAVRHELVLQALRDLDKNAQPGLVLEAMLIRLRSA